MPFYNFTQNAQGGDELYIDGEIAAEQSWWGYVVAPRAFRARLKQCKDVTVYVNSPGGDVFAAAEIYTALREHNGKVTVKVSGIAASAASMIAMAGDEVLMSPVAHMMIHYPWTFASGNAREMEHVAATLREVGEGMIAAYTAKTGRSRDDIARMLEEETTMNAQTCIAEGFADGLLYDAAETGEAKAGKGGKAVSAVKMCATRYSAERICAMITGAPAEDGQEAHGVAGARPAWHTHHPPTAHSLPANPQPQSAAGNPARAQAAREATRTCEVCEELLRTIPE